MFAKWEYGQNFYMRFLKNLFLFFSAFIPLFVLLLVKLLIDIINGNLTFNILNTFNVFFHSLLIILGIIGILWNTKFSKEKVIEITVKNSEEITDKYFLQYFALFVLFAVPLDISFFNEFFVYLISLSFIGIVYINCSLFYINPLLNILGFRFLNATYIDENQQTKTIKIFCKNKLLPNEKYYINTCNEHFSFITKNKK